MAALESVVLRQAEEIDSLVSRLQVVERAAVRPATPEAPPAVKSEPALAEPPIATAAPSEPPLGGPATAQPLTAAPPVVEPIPSAAAPAPSPPVAETLPEEAAPVEQLAEAEPEPVPALNDVAAVGSVPPPKPPFAAPAPAPSFDWESLIGVKLFAGIAGVALVLAAVFFLRYSIDQGWLQPPVRVAIGVLVVRRAPGALRVEGGARVPATANALDGAAIAILFATFFAAHTLWNLIPASATFVLLAIVTALAVLLSIRRESLFIAVLGLLGGFATPALVSTGENRPIPLFAYLLLLNVGLAWVAYRKVWPVLTWLTLGPHHALPVVWVATLPRGEQPLDRDGHLSRVSAGGGRRIDDSRPAR